MILGVDEVGRGPWAGPLVVGAVVLDGANIEGLTDSKRLSKKRREELDKIIRSSAPAFGLGWVSAKELDAIGMSAALTEATKRAVSKIHTPYHEIIIDGTVNLLASTTKGQFVTTLKKADLLVPAVSAASIIAKVARDAYMAKQDVVYPGYGFGRHAGYGTLAHREAIKKLGVTPLHRLSFAPLVKYAGAGYKHVVHDDTVRHELEKPSTKGIGDAAETCAVRYLETLGHRIVERNWRTKFCEIDIISQQGETVFFHEVKYRHSETQGGGLAAITPKKVRQMRFAAELYALRLAAPTNQRLTAIAVAGEPGRVKEFLLID